MPASLVHVVDDDPAHRDLMREILKGLATEKFEIAFPRPFVWQLMALRMLPYPWFFRLIRKATGL